MEVILDRDAFLKGLQMVQNIVEPRQTLPILANVLLETEEGSVRLTATDLEVGARVSNPGPRTHKAEADDISARKPAVFAFARLFAVVVCRAIAPRIPDKAV